MLHLYLSHNNYTIQKHFIFAYVLKESELGEIEREQEIQVYQGDFSTFFTLDLLVVLP